MQFSLFVVSAVLGQVFAAPHAQVAQNITKRNEPELVDCFGVGTKSDRLPFVSAIDNFCSQNIGKHLENGQEVKAVFEFGAVDYWFSAKAINGCSFTIDNNCNRLLRLPVDKCNTGGVNGKQGGIMTDPCGQWIADPGHDGNAF